MSGWKKKNKMKTKMKYIISESRLVSLIMNFLDDQFKGIKKHESNKGGSLYTWWGIGSEALIDMTSDDEGVMGFGFNSSVYEGLKRTFNLSYLETDEYLRMWVKENLGMVPEDIYIF